MTQKELLLEILSEEIPSRFQKNAIQNASSLFSKILKEYGTHFTSVESYISTRRVMLVVKHLLKQTTDLYEEKRGPRVSAPEKAISGFLNANQREKSELFIRNGYYYLRIEEQARDVRDIIPDVITEFIERMPWPKSMRWYLEDQGTVSTPWVRPIRSILCIYDSEAINAFIRPVGLTTCGHTFGHRFISPGPINVTDFADYAEKLEQNYVALDYKKKMAFINNELVLQAAAMGLCPAYDEELMEEVTGLVEYPFVQFGAIDEKYMKLPSPVLSTSMRIHQKYFPLVYPDSTPAPFYGTVTNVPCTQTIREGLDRVLRARLSDAMFFYNEDADVTLEAFAQRLSNVVFHEKLGSIAQKVDRMMSIANSKEEHRVVALCKADLLTQMVGEFPELQGVMGEIYALKQDESRAVAKAIREHYKPKGAKDGLPDSYMGTRVSFFDKLDTLVGFIGIGITPSGSKDPFALRRAALGIIRLLCDSGHHVLESDNLSWYIDTLISAYSEQGLALLPETMESVHNFTISRLKIFISDKFSVDSEIVDSVIDSFDTLDFDYKDAVAKAKKLNILHGREGFPVIREAVKRALGVIGEENLQVSDLNEKLIFENVHLKSLRKHIEACLAKQEEDLVFQDIVKISGIVLDVCDNVLINDKDLEIRLNNLKLLNKYITLVKCKIGVL
ncbi:MAG: glycine--tRNA ligase subunit beta [Holosporales bacterium]|jgi:glycyl-tRNA synthetase beta chain|nr:glycine--tRNA ligase subunit beta [Holosporales bacterium]